MERDKDLFLFRLNRLAAVSGKPLIRLCEGRHQITRREWRMIVILAQDGSQLSTELARRASVEPARTSRAVTELVAKGLVRRVPRPSDRRCIEIQLTDDGTQLFADLYPVVEQINTELLATLSDADKAHLDRLFSALEEAASKLPDIVPDLPKANRRRMDM